MKTSLALIVAATSVFVFTQAADAQCGLSADGVVLRAGCDDCLLRSDTTAYYAPTTTYYAPTTAYYAPTTAYYAPTHCLLSNFGVLRPNHGILRGQWLLRQWLLRRLLSRRIVRHWLGRLGRCSWNRPKVGSSRVVIDFRASSSRQPRLCFLRRINKRPNNAARCRQALGLQHIGGREGVAENRSGGPAEPLRQERGIDRAEVELKFQIAVGQIIQAGMLADDARLHTAADEKNRRGRAVVGSTAGVFFDCAGQIH